MRDFLRQAEAGQEDRPGRTLAAWQAHRIRYFRFKNASDTARLLEGLQKAGLA